MARPRLTAKYFVVLEYAEKQHIEQHKIYIYIWIILENVKNA